MFQSKQWRPRSLLKITHLHQRMFNITRRLTIQRASTFFTAQSMLTRPSIPAKVRLNSTQTEKPIYEALRGLKANNIQAKGSLNLSNVTKNIAQQKRPLISQDNINYGAKAVAEQLRVTGPTAGKIVRVFNGDVSSAYRRLKTVININNIRGEKQAQRFHKKPGKVLEEKRIRRKKKMFNEGVRRLMNLVKEAKRRGY